MLADILNIFFIFSKDNRKRYHYLNVFRKKKRVSYPYKKRFRRSMLDMMIGEPSSFITIWVIPAISIIFGAFVLWNVISSFIPWPHFRLSFVLLLLIKIVALILFKCGILNGIKTYEEFGRVANGFGNEAHQIFLKRLKKRYREYGIVDYCPTTARTRGIPYRYKKLIEDVGRETVESLKTDLEKQQEKDRAARDAEKIARRQQNAAGQITRQPRGGRGSNYPPI